jgi:hypothetical protein
MRSLVAAIMFVWTGPHILGPTWFNAKQHCSGWISNCSTGGNCLEVCRSSCTDWKYSGKKVKLSPCLTNFLELGTSRRWVVSFTLRSLNLQGKSPRYPLDRMLGGPQSPSGRRGEENCWSFWDSNCDPLVVQPVGSCYTGCTKNLKCILCHLIYSIGSDDHLLQIWGSQCDEYYDYCLVGCDPCVPVDLEESLASLSIYEYIILGLSKDVGVSGVGWCIWPQYWIFGFHRRREISRVTERLLAPVGLEIHTMVTMRRAWKKFTDILKERR